MTHSGHRPALDVAVAKPISAPIKICLSRYDGPGTIHLARLRGYSRAGKTSGRNTMHRRTVLSIRAMIVMAKGITIRCCIAAFALLTIFCVPLVPAWANAIVDTAFVAEALKRGAIGGMCAMPQPTSVAISGALSTSATRSVSYATRQPRISPKPSASKRYSAKAGNRFRRARLSCIRPAATSAPISRI